MPRRCASEGAANRRRYAYELHVRGFSAGVGLKIHQYILIFIPLNPYMYNPYKAINNSIGPPNLDLETHGCAFGDSRLRGFEANYQLHSGEHAGLLMYLGSDWPRKLELSTPCFSKGHASTPKWLQVLGPEPKVASAKP